MPIPFSGGCACGAIRYECSAEPVVSWQCHCRDCQHASGSAFSAVLYVPKMALSVTGENAARLYGIDIGIQKAKLSQDGIGVKLAARA